MMTISLRTIYRSTVWLALGLGLVACVASGEPAAETSIPANSPTTTPDEPATAPTASEEEPTVSPTATAPPALVLPDLGPAPGITNEVWLNTDQPLNLDVLRGRVVLVEFWTFG
jgi:hypothetical protein